MNNRSWWPLGRGGPDRAAPSSRATLRASDRPPERPTERPGRAKVIVIGNEKGGAGKTTVASLISVAMLYRGARVSVLDLDLRQSSLGRFMVNRRRWFEQSRTDIPMPLELKLSEDTDALSRADPAQIVALFEQAIAMAMRAADIVVIDTPGGDTPVSRAAHLQADLVVTPMNDSFVDFDVLGVLDPATMELVRASHYSRVVHEARRTRASQGRALDWVVVPNRLASTEPRNRARLRQGLEALAQRANFRIGPPLHERVIYRELFPLGLTIADLAAGVGPRGVSVPRGVVKDELRAVLGALDLDKVSFERPPSPPPAGRWGG